MAREWLRPSPVSALRASSHESPPPRPRAHALLGLAAEAETQAKPSMEDALDAALSIARQPTKRLESPALALLLRVRDHLKPSPLPSVQKTVKPLDVPNLPRFAVAGSGPGGGVGASAGAGGGVGGGEAGAARPLSSQQRARPIRAPMVSRKRRRIVQRASSPSHLRIEQAEATTYGPEYLTEMPGRARVDALLRSVSEIFYHRRETPDGGGGSEVFAPLPPHNEYSTYEILSSPLRRPAAWDSWTPREVALFEAGICRFGKDFSAIVRATGLKKSVHEVVEFYYTAWKHSAHYRIWKDGGLVAAAAPAAPAVAAAAAASSSSSNTSSSSAAPLAAAAAAAAAAPPPP
jgi:hypothetical protein